MFKKVILATGIASMAIALVAAAQSYSFQNNLTVGSTGSDVVALQTWLVANGYSIPSISDGTAAKGYFGSQTKSAVMALQTAKGLPSTGFFGPLTRGVLNGMSSMTTGTSMVACPAGYTCVSNTGTAPAGTTVTGAAVGISTPGVPGTLTASLWTSPSNGTVVYKGQSYDVVAVKLQAAASDMAVQSVSLDFSNRLWLYASAITLKDDTGAIVGQVTNLNSTNFSELTVGTDYRITIPVSNYVVRATQTRYITANITFLTTSDRASGTVGVSSVQVRSVDGTGVTDTETVNTTTSGVSTTTDTNGTLVIRTFNYQGNGAGSVVVTVDGSSPLAGLVQISTGGQTQNVPLAIYDIKSQNAPGTLQSITFKVNTNGLQSPTNLFSQFNIKIGGTTYGANNVTQTGNSALVTFTNFGSITLPADTYIPVTLMANVSQDTNNTLDGVIASTTLIVNSSNLTVQDQSYNNLTLNGGTFISSDLTFSGSSATLSNLVATVGSPITSAVGGASVTTGYNVSFSFTLTAGNNTLYIAQDPSVALATTSTGFSSAASSSLPFGGVTANPGQLAGETNPAAINGFYVIPAGTSRQFTYSGSMNNTNGSQSFKTFSITAVYYGTTTTSLKTGVINYNLQPLKVSATF